MKDKKVLLARACIFIAVLSALIWILSNWILNEIKETSYRWHPNIFYVILFIIALITLATGVSFLSELLKKKVNFVNLITGILAGMVFIFTLFPHDYHLNSLAGFVLFIGLTLSSILISFVFTLRLAAKQFKLRWLIAFMLSLNCGVLSFFTLATILRNENYSDAGVIIVGYCVILSIISLIINLYSVSLLKR